MIIGIEAQRVFWKNKHGMDYVVLEEIKQLQKIDTKNQYFVFVKPGEDHCLHDSENTTIIEIHCPSYPLWEQIALPMAARKYGVDVLHCTSNTAPLFCSVPLILTLHDIIFLEPRDKNNKSFYQNMGWIYRRMVVPRIINRCKRIITVSDFERNNIENKLHIGDRLIRIYNGYNEWFKPINDTHDTYKKYISEDGYFFFLGNTDPKKNTERTLIAYSKYLERSTHKRKLLLADLNEQNLNMMLKANDIEGIRDHIIISGYIVNSDLPSIYNSAFAFLYTSLRESFGIPLLEAMACGTPVITSNTSSMPEIASDEAILINPGNADEIAEAMLSIENDEKLYLKNKEMGLARAQLFSWEKTAKELKNLYEKFER